MEKRNNNFTYRNADVTDFNDAFRAFLKAYKLEKKYDETLLIHNWEKIMGKPVANRTTNIFIKNQKMYIYLSSAPLKQQLSMDKSKIIDRLNEEVGKEVIKEIYFY